MIEPGKLLQQRYRIDKQIGQGGMGAVYIATDERFGSTVAIKETLFMDDNYRKAIEREARLLNSLKHVALPRVSDHFLEENVQFLVMEYIPGEDLSHMLDSGVRFEVDRVLKWADQLLDALDFLHNQSIPVIHRDIKPQNLKLTVRDQIILLDFGLAKGNPTDAGHQTAAKSIFGYSRNYASLEQIQGTGTDPRSDLYSLSATLYHLLTGVPPDDALTRAMAVLAHRPDPLQPANAIRPGVSRGVAGVLQKALSLNADDRPGSAAEMRSMFNRSESFGYLADPVTVANARGAAEVSDQKTKLMPSDTRQDFGGQTDVKTAVMPGLVSQETKVRSVPGTGQTVGERPRRSGLKVAAAMAGILIACIAAAGLYNYDKNVLGDSVTTPAVPAEPQPKSALATTQNQIVNSEPPASIVDESSNVNSGEPIRSSGQTKVDTAKSSRPERQKESVIDPSDDVKIDGETIYIGNVKVGPEGITPNVTIDRNGRRTPIPPPTSAVPFPGITKEQFDQMTPRQRQELMEARRQLMMLQRRRQLNPPPPTATPDRP